MGELLDAITSWRTLVAALVVFGFAPGAAAHRHRTAC